MAPVTPSIGLPFSQSSTARESGISSTQKLITSSTSSHTVRVPGSTLTDKPSTTRLSTRISTLNGRSTTQRIPSSSLSTYRGNSPSVPSTITGVSSTTRLPNFSVISPGGNHPNYSTILPPISQGQHGAAGGDGDGANTSTIIAGVLVPLILIAVAALAVYIWYRRKYPVRMVLGRDFNRFSNPAYNKRASTLTLVRNDEQKDWDTLCRRNPDLSMINEDGPDGVENQAFDSENEEDEGIESDVKVDTDTRASTIGDIENRFEEEKIQNEGIRRERPKTKKAILVKTNTMEDFENGFELVTESDLGQRTESEISSGNDSTETHTISLTFSETFDDRHRIDPSSSDMGEVRDTGVISAGSLSVTNDNSIKYAFNENIGESISVQGDNDLDDTNGAFAQNNESFEIVSQNQDTDILTVQVEQNDTEKTNDTSTLRKEDLDSGNKLEMQVNLEINETNFEKVSNSASHWDEARDVSESKLNDKEQQEKLPVNKNTSTDTDKDEKRNEFRDGTHQDVCITEQYPSGDIRHDISFEDTSHPEVDKDMHVDKSTIVEICTEEGKTNIVEKEKLETLEKEKMSLEINELQAQPFIDIDEHATNDSQKINSQRKVPSLRLSNENIVLDSDQQSPTFVQESFILENESPLPVYLDSSDMSPRRGRRAFTLNDIASKHFTDTSANFEFSLPKLNDEKSKSSPVISELKNPNLVLKQLQFDTEQKDMTQSNELWIENAECKTVKTFGNYGEGQKQDSSFHELPETDAVNKKKDKNSVPSILDSSGDFEIEETSPIKVSNDGSDELLKSFNSNSFEFTENKSDYTEGENVLENKKNDDLTDQFNNINDDLNSTQQNVDIKNDNVGLLSFSDTIENTLPIKIQNKVPNEKTLDDAANEDNPFLENFLQSSTPTASIVVGETPDQNEDVIRKKLLPQSFDFDNFEDNDSECSSSSSENSEILDSPTSPGISVEETEMFSKVEDPSVTGKVDQQPVESFATEDMFSLTKSSDSSTTLSWEILSQENSHGSRSEDRLDLSTDSKKERASEDLEIFVKDDENNESISVTKSMSIDFNMPDVSKQSSANDTSIASIGSSTNADISWEIINEEGDNSEC